MKQQIVFIFALYVGKMRFIKYTFAFASLVYLLSACGSKKDIIYLQDIGDFETQPISLNYNTVFQPDDMLIINVTGSNSEVLAAFNLPVRAVNATAAVATGVQKQVAYLIRKDGTIEFPVLGTVQIAGLTMIEAIQMLKERLSEYLVDPVVNIEWLNYKFTVLGEVERPGTFNVMNERTTIFEALGMAGDLTITGVRDEVILIRELNGERKVFKLDLRSKEIFNSEAYFIKQNDVIYVQPNKAQVNASVYNRNAPLIISAASVLISLIVVISTRF